MSAHWGIEDPAAIDGTDIQKEAAFFQAFGYLKTRISLFVSLPISSLDRMTLAKRLREIGDVAGSTSPQAEVA